MSIFEDRLKEYKLLTEQKINECLKDNNCLQKSVYDAMNYSIAAGGKRIRPVLVLEFFRACGKNPKDAVNFAAAIEMIHTYSLIHDDLPCMDNDDIRRGKPSCHKAFNESTALLAGDGLLNRAFETMLSCPLNAENVLKAAYNVASLSGIDGMIGGQIIDLESENKDVSEDVVIRLYKDKTAALLRASALSGVILAGGDEDKIKAADEYATCIGLAFQIVDDILDIIGDQNTLGKPIGSDDKNHKRTYVSIHGIDKSKADVEKLTQKAIKALEVFEDNEFLKGLALYLCNRNY